MHLTELLSHGLINIFLQFVIDFERRIVFELLLVVLQLYHSRGSGGGDVEFFGDDAHDVFVGGVGRKDSLLFSCSLGHGHHHLDVALVDGIGVLVGEPGQSDHSILEGFEALAEGDAGTVGEILGADDLCAALPWGAPVAVSVIGVVTGGLMDGGGEGTGALMLVEVGGRSDSSPRERVILGSTKDWGWV